MERIERHTLREGNRIWPLGKLAPFVAILPDFLAISSYQARTPAERRFLELGESDE